MSKQNEYFPQSRPHPGETLKEWLDQENMTVRGFSDFTGIPWPIIQGIVDCKRHIPASLAIIFSLRTKIPFRYWINAQKSYNAYLTEKKANERLHQEIPPTAILE